MPRSNKATIREVCLKLQHIRDEYDDIKEGIREIKASNKETHDKLFNHISDAAKERSEIVQRLVRVETRVLIYSAIVGGIVGVVATVLSIVAFLATVT